MDIIYILLFIFILVIAILKFRKSDYSKETTDILKNNFINSNFSKVESIEQLAQNLEIKDIKKPRKSVEIILEDAKHKIDILYNYRMKHKLPYNELSFLKVTANCVIDYSISKGLSFKDSIKVLFLVLISDELEEILGSDGSKENSLDNFFNLLEGFEQRYKKRIEE